MMNWSARYTDLRSKIIFITDKQYGDKSVIERKAYAYAAFVMLKEKKLSQNDILAGYLENYYIPGCYPKSIREEIEKLKLWSKEDYSRLILASDIGLIERNPGCHFIPAYDEVLKVGIGSRIEQIKKKLQKKDLSTKEKQFYRAAYITLDARKQSILQYAKAAESLYRECRKENIKRIWENCTKIAMQAPEHLDEAIQLLFFLHEGVVDEQGSGSISFGRLDQYLYPYYQKDIEEKRIDDKEAFKWIVALWEKIAELEQSWQNVTLGGADKYGNDMSNALTIMCLKASILVHKDQPQVSLRVHENMSDEVWDTAFELVQTGMGFPELYNDIVAIKAKRNCGVRYEDAINYGIVGCVEIAIGGKEYSHSEGMRFNWAKLLEIMLNGGKCALCDETWQLKHAYKLQDLTSFDKFYEWYEEEFVAFTQELCRFLDVASKQYGDYWSVPFSSSIMSGCIENGRDGTDEGTMYNNLTIDCVGVASVANSLEAIEKIVYEDNILSLSQLSEVLKNNFDGFDVIREKLIACDKYGNDCASVDYKLAKLVGLFTKTMSDAKMVWRSGHYQAGFYTSYFHATMGKLTGALPDGRYAGMALSSSLSPMAGTDYLGPTALINSANKIDMSYFGNGMVLDVKFLPSFLKKESHRRGVRCLVEEYFAKGGMEIQFNVIDKETLLAAQDNPEEYKDLIVRVSGFSAYFVTLDRELQDEIIARTENGMV